MNKIHAILISLILTAAIPNAASASTFTFEGSEYTVIQSTGINWDAAQIAAEAAGGHLATITSIEESNFLKNTILDGQNKAFWLGAFQSGDNNRKNPTENWQWITGEEWDYTDWSTAEPNNAGKMNEIHLSADSRYGFKWNDEDSAVSEMINGYVIEKDLNSTPTPIPATIWLLGVSLAAVLGIKRKFS